MLRLENCTYRYSRRARPVIDALSIEFGRGLTLLLGPNGAGKSTLLAVAASALTPSRGTVTLNGSAVSDGRSRFRSKVAWMPQSTQVVRGLTVREQVAFHGWFKGMGRAEAWDASPAALARVGLDTLADKRASTLSGGQRARMGIAQSLLHDAEVMLLDEPSAALDPDQTALFMDLVEDLARDRTIVLSTHDTKDLAGTYDRVVVMKGGRVRFDGTPEAFLFLGERGSPREVAAYRAALGGPE